MCISTPPACTRCTCLPPTPPTGSVWFTFPTPLRWFAVLPVIPAGCAHSPGLRPYHMRLLVAHALLVARWFALPTARYRAPRYTHPVLRSAAAGLVCSCRAFIFGLLRLRTHVCAFAPPLHAFTRTPVPRTVGSPTTGYCLHYLYLPATAFLIPVMHVGLDWLLVRSPVTWLLVAALLQFWFYGFSLPLPFCIGSVTLRGYARHLGLPHVGFHVFSCPTVARTLLYICINALLPHRFAPAAGSTRVRGSCHAPRFWFTAGLRCTRHCV